MESHYSKIKNLLQNSLELQWAYCLSTFLTGQKSAAGHVLDSLACSQYNGCAYIINTFLGGTLIHYIVFMHNLDNDSLLTMKTKKTLPCLYIFSNFNEQFSTCLVVYKLKYFNEVT